MAWPTPTDYQTAVLNPAKTFCDPQLEAGTPETDKLGLPKPRSGSYAVAFKMQCGGTDYAVRCFLKESFDRQERYRAISEFLRTANLPYTVAFDYQSRGLQAPPGQWRPMLKMQWVHGDSLGTYVAKNRTDPQKLIEFAGRWVEMTHTLHNAGMAHGDLQHGNVIITLSGQIKLIDYDGMYVPALAGRPSEELGQRNYQSPRRGGLDFGPNLDNFSEWVIFASLLLLAFDPTLWMTLKGGDECLLFRHDDYDHPDRSFAFQTLENSKDPRVREVTERFRAILYYGPLQVPPIDLDVPATATTAVVPTPAALSTHWIFDHLAAATAQAPVSAGASAAPTAVVPPAPSQPPADSSWIVGLMGPPPTPQRFDNRMTAEWLVFVASATTCIFVVVLAPSFAWQTLIAATAANVTLWRITYRQQPVVMHAAAAKRLVAEQRSKLHDAEYRLAELKGERNGADSQLRMRLTKLDGDRAKIKMAEDHEAERPQAQLKLALGSINEARKRIADFDTGDMRQLQQTVGAPLLATQRELQSIDYQQATELTNALTALQQQYVAQRMQSARVEDAVLAGVGPARVQRLVNAGIRTAADMQARGLYGIPGIGQHFQGLFLNWARGIEAGAMRTRPTSLPSAQQGSITAKYTQRRTQLTKQRNELQAKMAEGQVRITAARQSERDSLARSEQEAHAKAASDLGAIRNKHAPEYAAIDDQARTARRDAQAKQTQIDQDMAKCQRNIGEIRWQLAKMDRERQVFRAITFRRYALRAISPFAG